jgi:glycosyltransferase involved in cell wall biosynthesis
MMPVSPANRESQAIAPREPIVFVRRTWPHWAHHGGYDRLFGAIETCLGRTQRSCYANPARTSSWLTTRVLERVKAHAVWSPEAYRAPHAVAAELRAMWTARRYRASIVHVAELETSFGLLGHARVRQWLRDTRVVATTHLPGSWWRLFGDPAIVAHLDALVTVSSEQRDFFEPYLPGRVSYIPHGIDTAFFAPEPGNRPVSGERRCLCVGELYRDMQVLAEVIERMMRSDPMLRFDLVYPNHGRGRDRQTLMRIARQSRVYWHSGLTDEQLRALYRRADLLVLPLIDCTANNALLEAMACGVPILTTDLPGVRDYVQPACAHMTPPHEPVPMAEAAQALLADPHRRAMMREAARHHAETRFSWPVVARQWIELYTQVCVTTRS